MTLEFPANPTLNQTYVDPSNNRTYLWNGMAWVATFAGDVPDLQTVCAVGSITPTGATFGGTITGTGGATFADDIYRTNTQGVVVAAGASYLRIYNGPQSLAKTSSKVSLDDDGSITAVSVITGNAFSSNASNGNAFSTTNGNVAITAAGTIISGGDATSGAANGSALVGEGGLHASSSTTSQQVIRAYTTGNSTPTFSVTAAGAINVAGDIVSGTAPGTGTGVQIYDSGRIDIQKTGGTGSNNLLVLKNSDSNDVVVIAGDGSVTAAGGLATIDQWGQLDVNTPSASGYAFQSRILSGAATCTISGDGSITAAGGRAKIESDGTIQLYNGGNSVLALGSTDGSAQFADGKITLGGTGGITAAGSIDADGRINGGTSTLNDRAVCGYNLSNSAASITANNYNPVGPVWQGYNSSVDANNPTSTIFADGSITAAGTILSGADPYTSQSNIGQRMNPATGIIARGVGSNQLWTGYATGSGDVTSEIKASGDVTFAGSIEADGDVTANKFYGDGSALTGVASSLQAVCDNGNTTTTGANFGGAVTIPQTPNNPTDAASKGYVDASKGQTIITLLGSVQTIGDLPSSGNSNGDAYFVIDANRFYIWNANGDVWFPGSEFLPQSLQSVCDLGNTSTTGINLGDTVTVSRTDTTHDCFHAQLNGVATAIIDADGSAIFAGNVEIGDGADTSSSTPGGVLLGNSGYITAVRPDGNSSTVFNAYKGSTQTVNLNADGKLLLGGSTITLDGSNGGINASGANAGLTVEGASTTNVGYVGNGETTTGALLPAAGLSNQYLYMGKNGGNIVYYVDKDGKSYAAGDATFAAGLNATGPVICDRYPSMAVLGSSINSTNYPIAVYDGSSNFYFGVDVNGAVSTASSITAAGGRMGVSSTGEINITDQSFNDKVNIYNNGDVVLAGSITTAGQIKSENTGGNVYINTGNAGNALLAYDSTANGAQPTVTITKGGAITTAGTIIGEGIKSNTWMGADYFNASGGNSAGGLFYGYSDAGGTSEVIRIDDDGSIETAGDVTSTGTIKSTVGNSYCFIGNNTTSNDGTVFYSQSNSDGSGGTHFLAQEYQGGNYTTVATIGAGGAATFGTVSAGSSTNTASGLFAASGSASSSSACITARNYAASSYLFTGYDSSGSVNVSIKADGAATFRGTITADVEDEFATVLTNDSPSGYEVLVLQNTSQSAASTYNLLQGKKQDGTTAFSVDLMGRGTFNGSFTANYSMQVACSTGTNNLYGGNSYFGADGSSSGNAAVVIKYDGELGVGTLSPTEKLDVRGNAYISGDINTDSNINTLGVVKATGSSGGSDALRVEQAGASGSATFTVSGGGNVYAAGTVTAPFFDGGVASTSSTPPSSQTEGQLWFDTNNGILYVWYHDGNSAQWVDTRPGGVSSQAVTNSLSALKSAAVNATDLTELKAAIVTALASF